MFPRLVVVAALFSACAVLTQAASAPPLLVLAASADQTAAAAARVDGWLTAGLLDLGRIQEDTVLPGRIHERLQQRHHGLRVYGGDVVRQFDGRGAVSVFGRFYDGITVDPNPAVGAVAAAATAVAAQGGGAVADEDPEIGVLPLESGAFALVYRVTVRSADDIHRYEINAHTGAIERGYTLLQSQAIIGLGTGVGGDRKKMSVNRAAGTFRTEDMLRPAIGLTLDFRGSQARLNAFLGTFLWFVSDLATDSDNTWTDGAVVDTHAYGGDTYDYLFKRFGRRGIDDANLQAKAIVHPIARSQAFLVTPAERNTFVNNALYFTEGLLLFGDGDGVVFDFLAGGLDVVAHETAHGVTEYSSGLNYVAESGALNEAFSDIIAAGAEFFFQPQGDGRLRADWLIGEDVTRIAPGFIRSMRNPMEANFPDHYSERFIGSGDNGGVHINASIVTHVFYLATAGGTHRLSRITVPGIGMANIERMERVFYRAFVFFLGSGSQFIDARQATLQAATDLFGASSNERAQLAQAWTAVGVN